MKTLRFIVVGSLVFLLASFINASSLDKIRAKQLSKERDNVNYQVITTKKQLKEYEKTGGMNLNKVKGRSSINYIEVKNVRESTVGNRDKFKKGLNKNKTKGANLGVTGTLTSGKKVTNIVDVKNSNLKSKNLGVQVKGKNLTGVNVKSDVNIKNSKIGGN